ncbi:MAG: cytochrome c oxidase accessory protein CcoG [Alphaproteobacteria bacterium]|nr:cytochrome c oxidase accessory protein CcoG [Alphaproteobacteria bacterium]MCB1551187.1 cytochrome c oxidase accessory protein CcoG [Alphaproteobacteria bacterium]MCB9985399.1 cytochrome c oxidase accessory protein CcoG [Micavibrio sp.]HPQ50379.1 cytochrome c oxidase accessory protein CcoG [Alphaproteobacteria bacterium]HRK98177.1 cytochrome c oxidase accessory protein CcoG [Alphaproteobacteria bacterium]
MNQQTNNQDQIDSQAGSVQYFAAQEKVYHKAVSGRFRGLKWTAMIVCLAIYYLSPFLRWARPGDVPDQAILIDLPSRRAYFFMIEIWPQEVYYITGILIFAAVALFFITSLLGRVWCGYFCFQTVWTDLYMLVERKIQGDRNARVKLDKSPLGFEKIWKKGLTHLCWILIGLLTAGAFVFYFNDAPTLIHDILNFQVSTTVLAFVGGLTMSTYIMAGFAREQVCTYMCPYARFQSAMFDPETLIIGYDETRGEQRGKSKGAANRDHLGDCVDCSLCVQVCPMGIDIRDGLQIQCIACGLCVDACDGVMEKVGKPKGLVRYDTEHNLELRAQGHNPELHLLRPRTVFYTVLLSVVGLAMLGSLFLRPVMEIHAIHDRNPLFVRLSDGSIRNGYEIKILNKTHEEKTFSLSLGGLEGAVLSLQGADGSTIDNLKVEPDSVGHFRVFVSVDKKNAKAADVVFTAVDKGTSDMDQVDSVFMVKTGQ